MGRRISILISGLGEAIQFLKAEKYMNKKNKAIPLH